MADVVKEKVTHRKINLLYNSFVDHMQLCRNTQHIGMMIGNATDQVETITLVFPAIAAQHKQRQMTVARTLTFNKNFHLHNARLRTPLCSQDTCYRRGLLHSLSNFHVHQLSLSVLSVINFPLGSIP